MEMADTTVSEITDEMIATEAAKAALRTEGVYSLLPGLTETIQENILRRTFDAPGVKVNRNKDRISIDMTLMTEYGYNIPSVAWNVQERVKKEIEKLDGLSVEIVDIHVTKIHFSTSSEENYEQKG